MKPRYFKIFNFFFQIYTQEKSDVKRESIYGWFPSNDEVPKRTPIDIYMNLGSRHPIEESFIETEILKNYVKEIHTENAKKEPENPEKAVMPPWDLSHKPTPNKPKEPSDEQKMSRSKSAPVTKYWRPKKSPLQIPKPVLYNLFSGEAKNNYFSSTNLDLKKSADRKTSAEKARLSIPKVNCEELGESTIEIVSPVLLEAQNFGKAPIITTNDLEKETNSKRRKKFRPKTAVPLSVSQQHIHVPDMKRSHTTFSIRKSSIISKNSDEIEHKINPAEELVVQPQIQNLTADDYSKTIRKSSAQKSAKIKNYMDNWKSNLLEREKFLHSRPNYFVKIDLNKLKPDRPAPEIHYKAAETFFLNTMPYRKATFTINPHFISENLNIQKIDLKLRDSRGSSMEPVKYRRDYAFVY